MKKNTMRAYYAARGGIEDAILEIRDGHTWGDYDGGFSIQWQSLGGGTYYKTSTGIAHALSGFDYPVTISVTLTGDPDVSTVNIVSESEIVDNDIRFSKKLSAQIVKSITGEVHEVSVQEIP